MKPTPLPAPTGRSRGSAFVTVMIFTCVLLIIGGSLIQWSVTERRLNMRSSYWLEARNAAEAVAEYGFAQVVTNYNSYASPPSTDPSGANGLTPPPTSFFSGGHVVTSNWTSTNANGMEIIGGTAGLVPSSGSLYYVDPNNPDNQFDTLKGQYVFRRDLQVLARATVLPPSGSGNAITAYVTEKVSVRGAPLFAHAIFYSDNDLEAAPGPTLDIYGPVHVNGNMFPTAQGTVETGSANAVNFHGPVSMTGNIYHAWADERPAAEGRGYSSSSGTLDGEPLGNDPVTFPNTAGTQVSLKTSAGVWKDSTMGNLGNVIDSQGRYSDTSTPALTQLAAKVDSSFRQYAAQTWNGNLQTAAMGVAAYRPISFTQPIDAAGTLPDPHSIIEAPDTTLTTSDAYYSAKSEVEKQKFSTQAGLYVQVTVTPGASGAVDSASINLYGPASSGGSSTDIGPNGGIRLGTYTTTTPNGLVKFVPFQASSVGCSSVYPAIKTITTYTVLGPVASKYAYTTNQTTTTGTMTVTGSAPLNGVGSSGDVPFSSGGTFSATGSATVVSGYPTTTGYTYSSSSNARTAYGNSTPVTTYASTGSPTTTISSSTSATVSSGMYDQRQLTGVDLVQIDMAALRAALNAAVANNNPGSNTAITNTSGNDWGAATANGGLWNGGMYIEVKSSSGGYPNKTSVALANGQIASGSSLLPTVNSVTGVMVATNAPVYVLGNFNADGSNASVSATYNAAQYPDDHRTNAAGTSTSAEVPIAIAADAVTILSPNYFGTSGGTNGASINTSNGSSTSAYNSMQDDGTSGHSIPTASGDTEVAAAFITGIVTTTSSTFSGGVHNLPRFIERWGSTVAIRGSLVSLFASKVATSPWAQRYYSAPTRNWGFDMIFQNGTFPPLTPRVMSYRRVDFTELSPSAYGTARHTLWPSTYTTTTP